jgi:hypothetical protein
MEVELLKVKERKSKFYVFNQNNSGGSFESNDKLCHRVIIEADNVDDAVRIAENMGIYFNGCDEGMDCPCCGDRWYPPYEEWKPAYGTFKKEEAESLAGKYGATTQISDRTYGKKEDRYDIIFTIEGYAQYLADYYGWTSPDVRIFYKDGSVEEFYINKK